MPPPPPVERKPSYIQFTPKRSIPSFENLVALANYEERLKGAKKIVWRDRGELPVEIHDLWECLKHATRGGLSKARATSVAPSVEIRNLTMIDAGAGTLAFVIRAGVNLILLLTRLKQMKRCGILLSDADPGLTCSFREHRFAAIRHALFGQDCFRFGAMLGAWSTWF